MQLCENTGCRERIHKKFIYTQTFEILLQWCKRDESENLFNFVEKTISGQLALLDGVPSTSKTVKDN